MVSWIGDGKLVTVFLAVAFSLFPKNEALAAWISFPASLILLSTLKSLYSDPRPYWISSDIKPDNCLSGFGNPSAHVYINSMILFTFYLMYYH